MAARQRHELERLRVGQLPQGAAAGDGESLRVGERLWHGGNRLVHPETLKQDVLETSSEVAFRGWPHRAGPRTSEQHAGQPSVIKSRKARTIVFGQSLREVAVRFGSTSVAVRARSNDQA